MGCADAFVTKINPDGASLAYSTYLVDPAQRPAGILDTTGGMGLLSIARAMLTLPG